VVRNLLFKNHFAVAIQPVFSGILHTREDRQSEDMRVQLDPICPPEMIQQHSSKAMRVPRRTSPTAEEIRALNEDLLALFEEGKRAGAIVEVEGPTKQSCHAKSFSGTHRKLSAHSVSWLFRSKHNRGACAVPTWRVNQGFTLSLGSTPSDRAQSLQGTQGSVFGWLKTSYLKFFMPNHAKEENRNLNFASPHIHEMGSKAFKNIAKSIS